MGAPPVEAGACQVTMAVLLAENQVADTPVGALGTVVAALHESSRFQAMDHAWCSGFNLSSGLLNVNALQ